MLTYGYLDLVHHSLRSVCLSVCTMNLEDNGVLTHMASLAACIYSQLPSLKLFT